MGQGAFTSQAKARAPEQLIFQTQAHGRDGGSPPSYRQGTETWRNSPLPLAGSPRAACCRHDGRSSVSPLSITPRCLTGPLFRIVPMQ